VIAKPTVLKADLKVIWGDWSRGGRIAILGDGLGRWDHAIGSLGGFMLNRLRQRLSDEGGFTLIELLVVILIIGILAAIAIPAFLAQKGKAYDASAKELARTAQTTAETYTTEHNGLYEFTTPAELKTIEPSINTSSTSGEAYLTTAKGIETNKGYEVVATANNTGDTFKITRNEKGEVSRTCSTTKSGQSGCTNDTW
jgi:type IV pilus assembly protein PilA